MVRFLSAAGSENRGTTVRLVFFFGILLLTARCSSFKNSGDYRDRTETFVDALLRRDYDRCLAQMALERAHGNQPDLNKLKTGLEGIREGMQRTFGSQLTYSLIKCEKRFSTRKKDQLPPNSTLAFIEFSNAKDAGVFQVLFDDASRKIINFEVLDLKVPKMNTGLFWLIGVLPVSVLCFNIYALRRIYKSTLRTKWAKYLAVVCLNIPTIYYTATNGFSVKVLHIQLLGAGVSLMGSVYSAWSFGIPAGALYWLWKLKRLQKIEDYDTQIDISYIGRDAAPPDDDRS